ncbi:MAG: hypothetical protein Q4B90_09340 [Eubacteriales bacterium]|nr:hypothetical protein [Eubacteriales bacterium]
MPKKEFIIISIWEILSILVMYFLPEFNNGIFRDSQDPEDRKYEKREQYNPLYRSGHLRKKRGKYDCFSEIKGFYVVQIVALIYISIWSIYGMIKYFFEVTNFFLEIILLGSWMPMIFLVIIMKLYYNFVVRKVTKKERNLTKEAKVLIYEIIGDLENQKISFLKKYVTPDLYSTLEKNFQNQNNRGKYKIKQIKLVNEKENRDQHREIWYEIMLVRMKFRLLDQGEHTVQYWKFVDKEEKLLADEILRDVEYQKKEERI